MINKLNDRMNKLGNLGGNSFTPLSGSLYVNFEGGNSGDYITLNLLSGFAFRAANDGNWNIYTGLGPTGSNLTIGTNQTQLKRPIKISGAIYNDVGSTRSYNVSHSSTGYIEYVLNQSRTGISMGAYLTFGSTGASQSNQIDHFWFRGQFTSDFLVINQIDSPTGLTVRAHSFGPPSQFSSPYFVESGKPYWVTLRFRSGISGEMLVYDPVTWQTLGPTAYVQNTGDAIKRVYWGHIGHTGARSETVSKWDNIILDYHTHKFPLLP